MTSTIEHVAAGFHVETMPPMPRGKLVLSGLAAGIRSASLVLIPTDCE